MDTTGGWPLYAFVNGKGKCRILHHDKNGYFFLLTNRDERIYKHRSQFAFLKDEETSSAVE